MSDRHFYVNVDKLYVGPKGILPHTHTHTKLLGGGAGPYWPPCSYAYAYARIHLHPETKIIENKGSDLYEKNNKYIHII